MMMIADEGLRTVVSGMRIAIVDETPNPGRTPINVPRKTPKKAITRFVRLNARTNPEIKWFNASIGKLFQLVEVIAAINDASID